MHEDRCKHDIFSHIPPRPGETWAVKLMRLSARGGTEATLVFILIFCCLAFYAPTDDMIIDGKRMEGPPNHDGLGYAILFFFVVGIGVLLIRAKAVRDMKLDKDPHYYMSVCRCPRCIDDDEDICALDPTNPSSPWFNR